MTTFQIARADGKTLEIQGKMANRHGLIAGATGTGKTVTLRRMAEAFSNEGVPVFLVDVKGSYSVGHRASRCQQRQSGRTHCRV